MQELLKKQLNMQNSLLCDGHFFHVRCYAYILNLIIQEALKVRSSALHKIKDSVKHVKSSKGRMKQFRECVEQVGDIDTKVGLHLDVPTRWNSTFVMLESAIKYKHAFSSLSLSDKNYECCLSLKE